MTHFIMCIWTRLPHLFHFFFDFSLWFLPLISPFDFSLWFLPLISPFDFSLWFLPLISLFDFSLWFLPLISPFDFSLWFLSWISPFDFSLWFLPLISPFDFSSLFNLLPDVVSQLWFLGWSCSLYSSLNSCSPNYSFTGVSIYQTWSACIESYQCYSRDILPPSFQFPYLKGVSYLLSFFDLMKL